MQALDLFEGLPVEAARHSLKHHDQEYDLVNEGVFTCFFTRAHEQAMPELPDRLPLAIDRRRSFRDRLCRSRSADSGMGLRQMCELRENGLFVTVNKYSHEGRILFEDILETKRGTSSGKRQYPQVILVMSYGEYVLQFRNKMEREGWYYSILYKSSAKNCLLCLKNSRTPEETVQNMKFLVDFYSYVPLKSCAVKEEPLKHISDLLQDTAFSGAELRGIVSSVARLLNNRRPQHEITRFLSRHMRDDDFAAEVEQHLGKIMVNLFKQGVVAREEHLAELQMCWLQMLQRRHGAAGVKEFLRGLHGATGNSVCPHPQVFNSIIHLVETGCFAAYDDENEVRKKAVYLAVFKEVVDVLLEFDDWRQQLSEKLRLVPFHRRALNNRDFGTWMANVIRNLSQDMNMENRMCILPRMSGRSGWLQHFRVGSPLYDDDGELFAALVRSISVVEGHQSEVLATLAGLLDSCLHVARNGCYSALEALERMVAANLIQDQQDLERIGDVLRESGDLNLYNRFMTRGDDEIDGPEEVLKMPAGSTSDDLREALRSHTPLLSSVDLQSTSCGCEAARMLSQFPNIKSMNWWCTPINDTGVSILCDNLRLDELDLSETQISNKGLLPLGRMTSLQRLRLDSTQVTQTAVDKLVKQLPNIPSLRPQYIDDDLTLL